MPGGASSVVVRYTGRPPMATMSLALTATTYAPMRSSVKVIGSAVSTMTGGPGGDRRVLPRPGGHGELGRRGGVREEALEDVGGELPRGQHACHRDRSIGERRVDVKAPLAVGFAGSRTAGPR